jgi:Family of unknown function (DUF6166)
VTTYIGARHEGRAIVSVVDRKTNCASMLDAGRRWVNHSPTGFEWGYLGSGPAQLAFAILLDHYGAPGPALLFYQDFKEHVIANFTANRWELTTEEIETALDRIRILRSRSQTEATWHSST